MPTDASSLMRYDAGSDTSCDSLTRIRGYRWWSCEGEHYGKIRTAANKNGLVRIKGAPMPHWKLLGPGGGNWNLYVSTLACSLRMRNVVRIDMPPCEQHRTPKFIDYIITGSVPFGPTPRLYSRDDDRHPHHLSTGFHPRQPPETTLRTPFTRSPQWDHRLPHRRRSRILTTTLNVIPRTKHTLPRHPPPLRHLPRQTRPRHAHGSRFEATHADGLPRAHSRGRRYDTRREGARRGGERACERGADGGTAAGGAQGPARICCGWVEGCWFAVTWFRFVRRSVARIFPMPTEG